MSKMLKLVVLSALLSICVAIPVHIDSDEVALLSKSRPCTGNVAGTRLRHPTDDHKFLRCVGPESFWIETCPDNLFYNSELDLCDWTVISETTTAKTEIVKFRPVLFRNNQTFGEEEVGVDTSKLPVRVVSQRIRENMDNAMIEESSIRKVPVEVESDEERPVEIERKREKVVVPTTTRTIIEPVIVGKPIRPIRPIDVKEVDVIQPVNEVEVIQPVKEVEVIQPVKEVKTPVEIVEPVRPVRPVEVTEVDVVQPVKETKTPVKPVRPVEVNEVDVVQLVKETKAPVELVQPVRRVKPTKVPLKSRPSDIEVEEVDVLTPVHVKTPVVTKVQEPVTIVEDLTPVPVKFIARNPAAVPSGMKSFGAMSRFNPLVGQNPIVQPSASVIRTDFIQVPVKA